MKIVDTGNGSTTALSTDLKNEPDQIGSLAPEGDYSSAQKRLNTSYMNTRGKKQPEIQYKFNNDLAKD